MKQELQQSRIGDVERDEAIGQLSDHFVAGRLDPAEFEERTRSRCARRRSQSSMASSMIFRVAADRPEPLTGHLHVSSRSLRPRSAWERP